MNRQDTNTVKLARVMELTVRTDRLPGALCRVLSAVAEQGVNIIAYSAYHDMEGAFVSLVTEEVMKVRRALEALGFNCSTSPVILVGGPDRVGAAASVGEDLQRAQVEVFHSYAAHSGTGRFYAVFKTDDDDRAFEALSVGAFSRPAMTAARAAQAL